MKDGEPYYIGIFLTGAYQDVMGDMHNLFGRINEVHVYSYDDDPKDFYIEEVIKGFSSKEVLSQMQYTPQMIPPSSSELSIKRFPKEEFYPEKVLN